jgi:hypothetical protein
MTHALAGGRVSADGIDGPTAASATYFGGLASENPDFGQQIRIRGKKNETIRCETLDGRGPYMVKSGETCTTSNRIARAGRVVFEGKNFS